MVITRRQLRHFFCLDQYFFLRELTLRRLQAKYCDSVLGWAWAFVTPALHAAFYWLLLSGVFRAEHTVPYSTLLVTFLFWNFFSSAFRQGVFSLESASEIASVSPIPIQSFPLVCTLTQFIHFLTALPLLLGILMWNQGAPSADWLALILITALVAVMAYCLGVLGAMACVFLKDTAQVLDVGLKFWFLATPVLYHPDQVPGSVRWVVAVNPLGGAFSALHGIFQGRLEWTSLGLSLAWTGILLAASWLLLSRLDPWIRDLIQ